MTPQEAKTAENRLVIYRKLEKRREQISSAIEQIRSDSPDDPNSTGPFTGNTRETRRINSIHIGFSETLGKSPPVEMSIYDLGIEASLFGRALLALLHDKLKEIRDEMEKL